MKISGKSTYKLAPEGVQQAVLSDVIDWGSNVTKFSNGQAVPQMKYGFHVQDEDEEGNSVMTYVETYPLTVPGSIRNAKANMNKIAYTLNGGRITSDDLDGNGDFDLDSLIGKNVFVEVTHSKRDNGDVFANVTNVTALPRGTSTTLTVPESFTRRQDRDETEFNTDSFDEEEAVAASAF